MKTAISIPDPIFASAQRLAKRLGVSRSELYVTALREFLAEHDEDKVMEKLNEVYDREESRLDSTLRKLQTRSIRRTKKEKW